MVFINNIKNQLYFELMNLKFFNELQTSTVQHGGSGNADSCSGLKHH